MSSFVSILNLDARGVMRDNVMLINIGLSVAVVAVITCLGLQKSELGLERWFPMLVAISLVTNPGTSGFLFGMLMVEEKDSGVSRALSVVPMRTVSFLAARSVICTALMIVWPVAAIYVMNITWQELPLSSIQVIVIAFSVAFFAPFVALVIPAFAGNKVEALGIFKGLSYIAIVPLALYFTPIDAWYRTVFLISPTAWCVFCFDAFRDGVSVEGYLWGLGGVAYNGILLALAIRHYLVKTYSIAD